VAGHYGRGGELMTSIISAIEASGSNISSVTSEDLSAVDEFHMGGKHTAIKLFDVLGLKAGETVLDVGCGLGGPARLAAQTYGCKVIGVDLTADFIDAGNAMSSFPAVSLDESVLLSVGNALEMSRDVVPDASIDKAYMLHVGMNIEDKEALATELRRVLKPGGQFACFDIMLTSADKLEMLKYPLPFASCAADASGLTTPRGYRTAFEAAGFETDAEEDWLKVVQSVPPAAESKLNLDMSLVLGPQISAKITNLREGMKTGAITAVQMLWTNPANEIKVPAAL